MKKLYRIFKISDHIFEKLGQMTIINLYFAYSSCAVEFGRINCDFERYRF